ncbi:hypothetical protein AAZV13_08G231500 [Glycine max]
MAADSLAVLAEALSPPVSPGDFLSKLRSDDAVLLGLNAFCSVLRRGLQSSDDGTSLFLSWTDAQIHAISSLAHAIASASRSLSVEQAEGVLVAIVQQSIEFALCYLENSGVTSDDLGIQNNMIHLLEMALVDGINMVADILQPTTASALIDMLPMVDDCCGSFVDDYKKCHLEGFKCSKEEKSMDWLLKTLASEHVPHDRQESGFIEQTYYQYFNNFVFLSQHWAVVHGKCTPRLILLCNKLAKVKDVFDERAVSQNFRRRLSFILRMLKILGSLLKDVPYVDYDASLMGAVATFSNTLSSLFRIKFEFVNTCATTEGSFESIILMVIEEFLHSVQVIFGNSNVAQNIQTCIIAAILESLDSSVWTYDKSAPNLKPPLAYFPRFVVYTLKLITDLKRQRHLVPFEWKDFDVELVGSSTDSQIGSPSCLVHLEPVPLLKGFTFEELLKLIFPVSSQWIANLMQLALFLHCEGLKLKPKLERSHSSLAKVAGTSEVENAVCHEDEALFGDLFSETGRSVGSTDGCEQPPVAALISSSSYQNMPTQAAIELLNFLKTCIFYTEWHPSLYVDACNKLSSRDIDILLSLLNCQGCCSEDNMSDSCTPLLEDGKIGQIHDLCFDILHNLLTNHALNDSLEDYLVDKILTVENGSFSYNDRTLTLLAHTLFCRVGSSGSQLRTKIFRVYVAFVVEKAKTVCIKCPSINDLVGTLPSLFHIEVVLMAFHLSSEGEKAVMAKLVFSTLKEVASLTLDLNSTLLTCWALVVSRLILILRHMIFYQQTCPTSLLIDVRSKLREAPLSGSSMQNKVNDHMSSWSSTAFKNIAGGLIGEEAVVSSLIGHLIDISGSSASLVREDLAIDSLTLNWGEIYFTFSLILGFWRGKMATAVEDLIVERYVFSLCWDIPYVGSEADHTIKSWDQDHPVDPSNMLHFFHFSHLLHGHPEGMGKFTISPDVILSLLQHLNAALPIPEGIEQLGWYFLRSGMWLSLVISFINVGIWRYYMDNGISGHGLTWTGNAMGDEKYVKVAGSMISSMIESGQFPLLVKLFSSLLNKYLQVCQNAFLDILNDKQKLTPGFSPFLLLKHTEMDQSLQDELLERSGSNAGELQFVLSLISRLDAVVDKKASGILSRASWECLLHGFPFNLSTPSSTMFSCVLSIRGIVFVLDGLLRIKEAGSIINLEDEILGQVLDAVMIIKYDRTFESVHGKCDTIYHSLSAELDLSCYEDLILMKQMEGFLMDVNAGGASDCSVHEWIICKIIEILNSLRKDPSKSVIFHFYLGVENVPEKMNRLLHLHLGDCLVLIDALDSCFSESVNVKVLGFFVDLLSGEQFPDLRMRIQRKFLDRDIHCVSKWLEKRLLGSIVKSDCGVDCAKGCSISLRESTMNFSLCLVSPPSEQQSKELQQHIFNSALGSLDSAFLLFDIHVAKSFFNFIVQISRGEFLMKQLLTRTVMLMEKLVGNENLLPGLKFLFAFIESVFSDCGSSKISLQKTTKKSSSGNSLAVGHSSARLVGSRKNSETFILSANQEGGSTSLECDATSMDEDEDDATSDGEVLSIDKDDEEDANSERALASKVCTFTSSGSNFMEQHWYFCYTCDLTVSKGCCSVCAKVCHRGHRVVYSRSSRFFCDCGAGGVRGSNCQCLKPRKFTGDSSAPVRGSNTFQSFLPFPEDGDQLPDSDSDFEEEISSDADNSLRLCIPKELQEGIPLLLEELDIESRVLNLCSSLLPFILSRRDSRHSKDKKISLGEDKVISHGIDLLQLKKAYKSGSFDLKIKVDYSNSKELKSHLASGSLVKSLLSVSGRGRLAAGEGDKVAIYDVGQLIGQATIAPVTADKTNVKPLSKNIVRFEIVQLAFNPVVENYLLVAGYEDCQVLTLNPRGEVIDRLAIELALQGAYIRRVDWVPSSQVQLMVVTNRFVKIYDLSLDNFSPMHYFTLSDDMIVDAVLCPASQGRMFLLVLSENGNILRLELSVKGNAGAVPLKELVQLQGKEIHAKGSSLYFSSTYKLLFVSFQDGTTVVGRPSPDAASLVEMSSVYEEQESKLRPAGVHHWKELLAGSGLYVCLSTMKSNSVLTLSMGEYEIIAQCMRHSVGSTSPIVGMTAYKPLSKDKIHCLVLHDDGSLQIYSHAPAGVDAGVIAASEKVKKLGSGILNKAYAGTNPEFPLDFFEKTVCITPDVKLGGDAVRNGDSEGAKQSLVNEDGFLESPSPAGFKISVFNSNPDIVMVGFRVHVGNTSASHIPSSISIFQRVVKFDEGMRSWYDIPFTVAESLLADEEFTISVGPTFNGSTLPRIDSLEVYGRAKDEFGWKEKMDAVLDMEARVLGSNSSLSGSAKKRRSMQSAPIQEQVIADGLRLITKFYSSCKQQDCSRFEEARTELGKLKCKPLLEIIFECDREPILQASASRVLQAVFPKKEIYHQVKDTMRLRGVVKSSLLLSSRLGIGGAAGSWIIEEFTTQMRAVCKIALQHRSNLATFLETNGSEVVDVLVQVLWGILDFEQPDTQTMNNIVMSAVELIYCYAECLALHGKDAGVHSVAPAVVLLKKLLFSSNEAVQTASSLAISSRLLQVPFPKQTMLATDDAVDSVVSVSGPADPSTGNNQIMIEDDTITSSVQYCCDGCSTVPILRRRWHCTVCPDFDLCEACYEVLDADRLPPPHSRDHPMTAIPIEVDSVGDGNEFHFTADDVSDQNLLPVPVDSNMQNSSPSIHVLEPNDSGDFAASLTDPVSISASKRAINSLLLSELLEHLKGWMDMTSGVQAIPVMQLFYRLSSAVGGPFIGSSKPDSLDLEKLIKWFLDEINLNRSFVAKTRSSFGEVAILVFMFFTLMLRNWHQPGSDGPMPRQSGTNDMHDKNVVQFPLPTSASAKTSLDDQEKIDFTSQLLRACDSLRQQSFVNYLMDILQQLVYVFKSPVNNEGVHSNAGPGCGALLTIRRDLPAGNFLPFFSDSYAKVHRTDIFMDYHRLLLENAFRLVYTLVRPEKHDKTGEKEKVYKLSHGKDLKLDGYQDVLCSYINNPHTNFVRRYARRLFLHLCGTKSHYYSVRDSWQFSSEAKRLYKHINKSGGFQNNPIPYERSVKIVKCLSTMAEVAAARPRNWQKYCLRHGDILSFLMNGIFYFGEESVIQTLKLLNFAFYTGKDVGHTPQKMESGDISSNKSGTVSQESKKKKKGEDGAESGSEKSYLDMEAAVDVFTDKSSNILKQFIDCFLLEWNSITMRAEALLFLTVQGCLRTICTLITQEVSNVESLERSLHIDITQGFILHKLIELLGKFLEVPNIRSRFMRDDLLSEILEALIVIRGLIVQKTKLISDCNRLLKDLLDSLLLESSENKRQFIRACINGLEIHREERKGRACLFILEQLCNVICPSKPEPVYLLVLNKAHTQEEFIRGSMTKNPYSSVEIGPLMRDVKNKICHQLDLLGLLEDDYGMELLVAGNIISLDLSIAQVYEQVWKKSNQSSNVTNSNLLSPNAVNSSRDCPPMTVTYRLQGLDGEATEPMIKELEEDREESQDPEVEFAIAGAVRECGGLEILLGMIQRLRDDFKSNQEQLVTVLNLLMYCCKIRENRRALLKLGALGLLLEAARRAFSVDAMEPAEGILLIVESLTLEANESDNISITQSALTVTSEEAGTGEQAKKIVLMFLERLSHPLGLKKSNKQQRNTEMVARILPYLTYGEPAAMDALVQHFSPYLQDWGAFDHLQKQHLDNPKDDHIAQQAAKQRFTLENFVRVSESLKTSSCGERLKDIILEKGITKTAMTHLKDSFAYTGQAGFKNSAEWAQGLTLPSVPLILSMLRGLSMGHLLTKKCVDEEGILPLLHALEGVAGVNEIGARAEYLLDTLSNKEGKGDGFLEEKVCKLRHATKDEMRRRALQKREELLQGLGMHRELFSDGGERIVVSRPVPGIEDVQEEEDGLACMVCQEGYSLRPADLLGAYSYSKRVNLGVGSSGSARGGECVYTTVSYFNIIHFQCHQEAKRADAALKNPKKEWDGATLRNNESLCNSLFPVRGPSVPLAQYVRYVDQYWDNLNGLGRADGSRLRLLTYDIVLMLARFATGASFSADSRGGGRESNSRFLPFMIQMARHLLDQGNPSQRRTMARAVSAYISSSSSDLRPSSPSGTQPTPGTEEIVQFMMVNSFLSESYESWLQHRRAFLQRGIYHAYMQHTHSRSAIRAPSVTAPAHGVESGSMGQSATTETGQSDDLLSIIRPMLVYTGLIEQLQHFFKVKKSTGATPPTRTDGASSTTEGEDESGNLEGWEVVMKERLLNVKELLGFPKEMLSWLDEINSATDLQEAFDIVGVLAEVLSGGFTQCEDFVQGAINAGKS